MPKGPLEAHNSSGLLEMLWKFRFIINENVSVTLAEHYSS